MAWATHGLARLAVALATAVALGIAAALWLLPAPEAADAWIAPAEAYRLSEAGKLTIVDVRSPVEWRETGVPEGAATVTIHHPRGMDGFLEDVLAAVGNARDAPVAVICAAGERSSRARDYLEESGFTAVRDVTAGMLGRAGHSGWLDQGLPVDRCARC